MARRSRRVRSPPPVLADMGLIRSQQRMMEDQIIGLSTCLAYHWGILSYFLGLDSGSQSHEPVQMESKKVGEAQDTLEKNASSTAKVDMDSLVVQA